MILSQFQLNLSHTEARRDLGNPYDMHRTLSTRLLAGKRGLWRLEENTVLLLSEAQPQWSELAQEYLVGEPRSKDYPVREMKLGGRRFHFLLKANPTKSVKEGLPTEKRGKRVQLLRDDHKLEWLGSQGSRNGFQVLGATTSATRNLRFRKKKGQPEITLGCSVFEGLLEVDDESQFRKVLTEGIGRAKSFGMGLLSIAPA